MVVTSLGLLVRQRCQAAWNRLTCGQHRARRMLGTGLAVGFTFGFVLLAGLNAGMLVDRVARVDPQTAVQALPVLLVGVSVLTLLTSLSSAFHHLFLAADLEILQATPVPPSSLFGLKILEIWRDSLHVILFQAAALFGFGQSLQLPAGYYVAAFATGLLLTLTAAAVGAALTLVLARVRFGESILGVSRVLAILLFLPVGVLGIPALGFGRGRVSFLFSPGSLNAISGDLRDLGAPPAWAPTTWAAHVVLGDDTALLSLGLLLATAVVLFCAAQLAYSRLFQAGWERVRYAGPSAHHTHRRFGPRLPVPGLPQEPVAELLVKDWRTVIRDPRWRTGTLVSLVALGLPALLLFTNTPLARSPHAFSFWFGMLPVPYLAYLVATQQGASTLTYEGRNLALLRAAPVGMQRILLAKTLGGLVLVLLVTWSATLALGLTHNGQPLELAIALAAATWLALGGTLASIAGAALTADFEGDNPQRRVGCVGTLFTSALSIFFFVANTAVLAWWVARSLFALPRGLAAVLPIIDWGLPSVALLSAAAIVFATALGMQRLAGWEMS